ncbi:MAG: hypothetical protein GX495_05135 [Chloroflexi bacterium]|nr:hypothetical protein [Chloroflexota bacterium]
MQLNDELLSPSIIAELRHRLLNWYDYHGRNFPWRNTSNPFHILISEKLLQRTSVGGRVIDAYIDIVTRYPTPKALSLADEAELAQIVAPLGLHYRAKELIDLAKAIDVLFSGNLPNVYEALMSLPGVGEYSARAVLSFAYNQNVAVVDSNVARILFRILGITAKLPENPARKKYLVDLATSLMPEGKSRVFNYAVLDFSALICKPRNPECRSCPINQYCFYYKHHFQKTD